MWLDPTFGEAPVNNGILYILYRYRRFVDSQDTGALAGGRTSPASKFRESIGRVQTVKSCSPAALVNVIVPLRNEVIDGTTHIGLAKRHAAIHTPGALPLEVFLFGLCIDFTKILLPIRCVTVRHALLAVLHEACGFTHSRLPYPSMTEDTSLWSS